MFKIFPTPKKNVLEKSDEELMLQFQKTGAANYLQELSRRHASRAAGLALYFLRSRAQAEDAVQESFIRLIRARDQYDSKQSFAPWFFAMVRNICLDQIRDRSRRSRLEPQAISNEAFDEKNAQEDLEKDPFLWDCVHSLGKEDAEILLLRFRDNLPFAEIAICLEISEESAKKRAQRALLKLRQRLVS